MHFEELLRIVEDEPVFDSALLLVGDADPADVRRQLCRWVKGGRVLQLRRGLYALAPPYRKVVAHPFLVANRLMRASYVSLQSALAFAGLIPEHVAITTSVTAGRPQRYRTPLGGFEFRHLSADLLTGYRRVLLSPGQEAFVATPEKALLDLVHLEPRSDAPAYLEGLRLAQLDQLDTDALLAMSESSGSPKLRRAAAWITRRARDEAGELVAL